MFSGTNTHKKALKLFFRWGSLGFRAILSFRHNFPISLWSLTNEPNLYTPLCSAAKGDWGWGVRWGKKLGGKKRVCVYSLVGVVLTLPLLKNILLTDARLQFGELLWERTYKIKVTWCIDMTYDLQKRSNVSSMTSPWHQTAGTDRAQWNPSWAVLNLSGIVSVRPSLLKYASARWTEECLISYWIASRSRSVGSQSCHPPYGVCQGSKGTMICNYLW